MIPVKHSGIVQNLDIRIYHAPYSQLPALGSSQLKHAKNTMAKFKAAVIDNRIERTEKTAFDIGSAANDVILEQKTDRFVCGPDVSSKAVKEWKAFAEDVRARGKIPLTPDEYKQVLEMFEGFFQHPNAHKIVSNSLVEQSIFWTDKESGLWLKARPDGIYEDETGVYIWDYKTVRSLEGFEFQKSIVNYGYHISAAHYVSGYETATNKKVAGYFYICQEKEAPCDFRIFITRISSSW
jgi:hypothetical protein